MDEELKAELARIQEALGRIEARLGAPTLPLRARTILVPPLGGTNVRWSALMPHAEHIYTWLNTGKSQAEILGLLLAAGVKTSRRSLNRFIRGRLRPDVTEGP